MNVADQWTVEHVFSMTTRCPVNGKEDDYTVTLRLNRTVLVEVILGVCERLSGREIFQEDLTRELAETFRPYAIVETTGVHSGVATRCRRAVFGDA